MQHLKEPVPLSLKVFQRMQNWETEIKKDRECRDMKVVRARQFILSGGEWNVKRWEREREIFLPSHWLEWCQQKSSLEEKWVWIKWHLLHIFICVNKVPYLTLRAHVFLLNSSLSSLKCFTNFESNPLKLIHMFLKPKIVWEKPGWIS